MEEDVALLTVCHDNPHTTTRKEIAQLFLAQHETTHRTEAAVAKRYTVLVSEDPQLSCYIVHTWHNHAYNAKPIAIKIEMLQVFHEHFDKSPEEKRRIFNHLPNQSATGKPIKQSAMSAYYTSLMGTAKCPDTYYNEKRGGQSRHLDMLPAIAAKIQELQQHQARPKSPQHDKPPASKVDKDAIEPYRAAIRAKIQHLKDGAKTQ